MSTQQVSVSVMKPQSVVLLGLQSIFHDTFHYSSVLLKLFDSPQLLQRIFQTNFFRLQQSCQNAKISVFSVTLSYPHL